MPDEIDRVGRAHAVCETIQEIKLSGRDHARGAAVCERNVIHQRRIRQIRIGGFVGAVPRLRHPRATVETPGICNDGGLRIERQVCSAQVLIVAIGQSQTAQRAAGVALGEKKPGVIVISSDDRTARDLSDAPQAIHRIGDTGRAIGIDGGQEAAAVVVAITGGHASLPDAGRQSARRGVGVGRPLVVVVALGRQETPLTVVVPGRGGGSAVVGIVLPGLHGLHPAGVIEGILNRVGPRTISHTQFARQLEIVRDDRSIRLGRLPDPADIVVEIDGHETRLDSVGRGRGVGHHLISGVEGGLYGSFFD